MRQLSLLWLIAAKDVRIELRSRQSFYTVLFFSMLVLIVFQFAFDPGSTATREAAPGILWVALMFPGMIRLNQSFALEAEEGSLQGIVLSPLDRGVLFLGKFLGNWLFLILVDLVIVALFIVFFNYSLNSQMLWVLLLVFLGMAGFCAVGTVLAAMVSGSRGREVLLPILIFPLMIPVIVAAVNGSQAILVRDNAASVGDWIKILAAFDVVYLSAGFLVFDYVVGE